MKVNYVRCVSSFDVWLLVGLFYYFSRSNTFHLISISLGQTPFIWYNCSQIFELFDQVPFLLQYCILVSFLWYNHIFLFWYSRIIFKKKNSLLLKYPTGVAELMHFQLPILCHLHNADFTLQPKNLIPDLHLISLSLIRSLYVFIILMRIKPKTSSVNLHNEAKQDNKVTFTYLVCFSWKKPYTLHTTKLHSESPMHYHCTPDTAWTACCYLALDSNWKTVSAHWTAIEKTVSAHLVVNSNWKTVSTHMALNSNWKTVCIHLALNNNCCRC